MDETSDTSATPSLLFPERREEAYRAMADESPDALLVHSGRHFVYANAPALKLVGAADIAQLSAIDPVDIVVPEQREIVRLRIATILTRQVQTPPMEQQWRTFDGEIIDVEVSANGIAWEGSRAIELLVRDVTERKRQERERHAIHRRLQEELVDMQLLQETASRLISEGGAESLYSDILDAALAIADASGGAVLLLEEHSRIPRLLVARGLDAQLTSLADDILPDLEAICRHASRKPERIFLEDISRSSFIATATGMALADRGFRSLIATPLVSRGGECLGLLATWWLETHDCSERELRAVDILVRQGSDLIERNRALEALRTSEHRYRELSRTLEERVGERTEELELLTARLRSLAAELDRAQQQERKRFAGLLHDDIQQLLSAAHMHLELTRGHYADEEGAASGEKALSLLEEAVAAARSLTKLLIPPALYEFGLPPALDWLADQMRDRHNLAVDLHVTDLNGTLSDFTKALLFDCARELLFNVVKHASVHEARLEVGRDAECLRLVVMDAGVGFDPAEHTSPSASGFGLFGIRERVLAAGGTLAIESARGAGTRVEVKLEMTCEM